MILYVLRQAIYSPYSFDIWNHILRYLVHILSFLAKNIWISWMTIILNRAENTWIIFYKYKCTYKCGYKYNQFNFWRHHGYGHGKGYGSKIKREFRNKITLYSVFHHLDWYRDSYRRVQLPRRWWRTNSMWWNCHLQRGMRWRDSYTNRNNSYVQRWGTLGLWRWERNWLTFQSTMCRNINAGFSINEVEVRIFFHFLFFEFRSILDHEPL